MTHMKQDHPSDLPGEEPKPEELEDIDDEDIDEDGLEEDGILIDE